MANSTDDAIMGLHAIRPEDHRSRGYDEVNAAINELDRLRRENDRLSELARKAVQSLEGMLS